MLMEVNQFSGTCGAPRRRIHSRIISALSLLLLMTLPSVLCAQFDYATNDGTITITGYTGAGGALSIPSTITGLPVTSIGDSAFYDETGLTSVMVPSSVTNIGDYAFYGCTSLTGMTIPNRVTRIGNYQFRGCTSLASITMPSGVTGIGFGAFAYCVSLTSVPIPHSVSSIGFQAFASCTNLTGVYFQANAPTLGSYAFDGDNLTTVYYLPGTTGWLATYGGRPTVLWNPTASTSAPNFGVRNNRFGFTISGSANIPLVVEASASAANSPWLSLQNCTLTNGSIYFSDAQWINYPRRTYRIRSP